MQAIVLAAGEGSRMRPLTSEKPKVMLPVCGRPLLEEIALRAIQAGIDEFVFVVGYGADAVRSYFGDGSKLGVKISYAVQERQLGTGHALQAAEDKAQERFFVLNGDIIPDSAALNKMMDSKMAVAAFRVADPSRYGVFTIQDGLMRSVVEKSLNPPSNMANAGIYLFNRSIFDALSQVPLSSRGEYELTDGLNILAPKEKIQITELQDWMEVGRPWDILAVNEALLSKTKGEGHIEGDVEPGAVLKGYVSAGKGTIIRSGSYIAGPVIIGEDCDIGPNCYIRPTTCIGNRVRVGNAVEVKNSTIMDDTKVGHLAYVGDSVIGSRCNFGAGTLVSNLRHDKKNIRSYIKGHPVDSSRRKLGTIMGDDVKTGINTSIYPGTVIEPGYKSLPSEVLKGLVVSPRDDI